MIIYTLIGLVWTLFFEWLLKTHGPDGEGLPTIRARIFHIILWPLAVVLVIRNLKDE
jgi:hypothetical protein